MLPGRLRQRVECALENLDIVIAACPMSGCHVVTAEITTPMRHSRPNLVSHAHTTHAHTRVRIVGGHASQPPLCTLKVQTSVAGVLQGDLANSDLETVQQLGINKLPVEVMIHSLAVAATHSRQSLNLNLLKTCDTRSQTRVSE